MVVLHVEEFQLWQMSQKRHVTQLVELYACGKQLPSIQHRPLSQQGSTLFTSVRPQPDRARTTRVSDNKFLNLSIPMHPV